MTLNIFCDPDMLGKRKQSVTKLIITWRHGSFTKSAGQHYRLSANKQGITYILNQGSRERRTNRLQLRWEKDKGGCIWESGAN